MCKVCKNAVETKIHFLFECTRLQSEQLSLYHKVPELLQFPEHSDKLKILWNMPFTLSNYIYKIWKMCSELVKNVSRKGVKQPQ